MTLPTLDLLCAQHMVYRSMITVIFRTLLITEILPTCLVLSFNCFPVAAPYLLQLFVSIQQDRQVLNRGNGFRMLFTKYPLALLDHLSLHRLRHFIHRHNGVKMLFSTI